MEAYTMWVKTHPLLSAFVQFAVLGTLGEFISALFREKQVKDIAGIWRTGAKMVAWGILGLVIKFGFVGMKGAVRALIDHHYFPSFCASGFGWAFTVSTVTNLFFGPQMMFFHRLEENLIARQWDLSGLTTAFKTLVWFWIPAHTVTFMLPVEFQIGLAALWSIALGIILGFTAPNHESTMETQEHSQTQTI